VIFSGIQLVRLVNVEISAIPRLIDKPRTAGSEIGNCQSAHPIPE
jgi:hypothetical protein